MIKNIEELKKYNIICTTTEEVEECLNMLNTEEQNRDIINDNYNITILPNFIKIGCQLHPKEEWWNFSDKEIEAMDGIKAIHFWKKWKPILKAICDKNK